MQSIHEKINKFLEPAQGLITVALVGVAGLALYAAFVIKDPATRTAIATWMIWP